MSRFGAKPTARLRIDHWRIAKPGFRAKISADVFIFREGERLPVAGPFRTRDEAEAAMQNKKPAGEKSKSHSIEEVIDEKKTTRHETLVPDDDDRESDDDDETDDDADAEESDE